MDACTFVSCVGGCSLCFSFVVISLICELNYPSLNFLPLTLLINKYIHLKPQIGGRAYQSRGVGVVQPSCGQRTVSHLRHLLSDRNGWSSGTYC